MNTQENLDIAENCDTQPLTVQLVPASELIDGASDIEPLTLSVELIDDEIDLNTPVSAQGLRINAKLWRMRNWIEKQVAPQRDAIRNARKELFGGWDNGNPPASIKMAGMTRN